tara:strand:+ start:721 stop:939 length:219 start_codon:yes stop_codon:yes gene_type:complete
MKTKTKCFSIRGGLARTYDGAAVLACVLFMFLFLFFGFFLGVITNNPIVEENEKTKPEPYEMEKYLHWVNRQ